ncbi:MAG: hypothetical protein ETSY1_17710 [Candidatus Entotheonella factor]|uniref:Radical SAM core domain-containing protein n=1 Tax=Entotheonella factor TaxID=1429438 RepID=W4LKS1_ENTF1|nr:B12-binding domain-containing radical SAM protein [Candidatus Entotheonella palauensis]ETW98698.1 MAG: hypothetical protein ETSY1_17710 [Candidatus Entotheonella factor]
MKPSVLLVNPPIYDFSAYDYWLKPYGLLRVAGLMREQVDMQLFDYLDRWHAGVSVPVQSDAWGRGPFHTVRVPTPEVLTGVERPYRRYGRSRQAFQAFLSDREPFDVALVQTVMTYWYLGVQEVIEDIRARSGHTQIVLGGVYATLCPEHAAGLGADWVIERTALDPLWQLLRVTPRPEQIPLWEAYETLRVGCLKLADGCPFRCTYCSVPQVYPPFAARPLDRSLAELAWLCDRGVENVAFYDDALLFKPQELLLPFLREVVQRQLRVHFHTPNALNARFITQEVADLMVAAGFKTFHLGFESSAYTWQRKTGGKVYAHELEQAVTHLVRAGADRRWMTAYLIVGHPQGGQQDVESSMRFAHETGLRVMLSEFSPIPGTPDGESCREWVDLDEPLWHNKTIFPLVYLGDAEVQRLKSLARDLNRSLEVSWKPTAVV